MVRVEEGGAVGGGAGRGGPYNRGRGQRTSQLARPVDQDPGGRQPVRGPAEEVFELRIGEGEDIGYWLVQQPQQRRPDPGGPAQRQYGVDPGARPEAGGGRTRPQQPGVGDEGGVGEAVDLDDGGTRAAHVPRVPRVPLVGLLRPVEEAEGRQVEAQRNPHAGIGARRDLRGPFLYPGHPLRLLRGERPPGGHRRRRGAGQAVGDGIEERPDQGLRFGQLERAAAGQGVAYPSYGSAAATARRCPTSSASSGPARQASTPSGVTPGSSRPRATSARAWRAAVPQARVAGCVTALCGARASRGRASVTERPREGTVRVRIPGPWRRTTASGAGVPAPSGSASPSGDQKAMRASRGTGAGRKTAAWRRSALAGGCGVTCRLLSPRCGRIRRIPSAVESRRGH